MHAGITTKTPTPGGLDDDAVARLQFGAVGVGQWLYTAIDPQHLTLARGPGLATLGPEPPETVS